MCTWISSWSYYTTLHDKLGKLVSKGQTILDFDAARDDEDVNSDKQQGNAYSIQSDHHQHHTKTRFYRTNAFLSPNGNCSTTHTLCFNGHFPGEPRLDGCPE